MNRVLRSNHFTSIGSEVVLAGAQQTAWNIQLLEYAAEKPILCQPRQIFFEPKIEKNGWGVNGKDVRFLCVIPAKAGIQFFVGEQWIPVSAGMTITPPLGLPLMRFARGRELQITTLRRVHCR
jgi:hypothetical protein